MGARLAHFAPIWAEVFGQDSRPARTVREGVGLSFKARPPLTRHPVSFATHSSLDALKKAVAILEQKRVIIPVRDRSSLGFYSRLFLVPKRSGEDRPVIDLSPLNRTLEVPSFRMETQQSVREAIQPGEWVTSIDIRDAYLHVPMATATQRYLRFRVGSEVHQFRSLPFGLSTSPREFTKLLQPIVQLLRAHGIRVHAYLDDWLIRSDSPQQARHDATLVANVIQAFGWVVNQNKSCLVPSQDFIFLGMHFNTSTDVVTVAPSEDIRDRLNLRLQSLQINPEVTARQLTSLFGLVQYMAALVPHGHLRLRPLRWAVTDLWSQATGAWTDRIVLPSAFLTKLNWWVSTAALSGVPTSPPAASVTLFTDASASGWGAIVDLQKALGVWPMRQQRWHINALEIQAVWEALHAFAFHLTGKTVRVMIDNRTAVSYLRCFGGTRSRVLSNLAVKVQQLAKRLAIVLRPVYIPGARNVEADGLSRQGQTRESEWCINHKVLEEIFLQMGHPWLDMFATRDTKRLDQFVSPYPDPEAFGTDALALNWDNLGLIYAFPPDKDSERSDQEVCELFGSPNDPGSPPQGLSLLGPRLAQTLSIETEVTFQSETVTSGGSGPRENIPQSAQLFKPSRLASLVAIYHSQGFSLEAAELMARPQRTSTTTLYQSRWVSFMEWLRAKGSLPDQVTLSMFTDYLVALFNKGLSPSAIKGHRAAVGAVYKALNSFDASNDIHLTHLMRRFQVERPRKRITMPRWDLGIVLRSFLRAPYVIDSAGSDHGIDLKWLTLKTVFLVALASGRRVSYIRALAYEFTLNRGSVHSQHVLALSTLPEFRAKNQRSSDKPMFVSLPGIAHLVPQEPERFLCPVRCLRMYAHVTADRHNHCPRMFVHWLPGKADITSGSISRWIMLAVRKAYVATGQNAPSGISAHELRALSASWAYTNHADLDDIKAALFWRSSGVFQDSYLRNMASSRNELNRLGPLVTAGMVIDPR